MNDADSKLVETLWSQCPKRLPATARATIVLGMFAAPKQHPLGMTSYRDPGNDPGGPDFDLFKSPADFVAPGDSLYRDDPPAADGRKVIILDTDHMGAKDESWVWKAFTRGMNPIYMDTWEASAAKLEASRKALGHVVALAKKMNLSAMTPRNELASTRYCLATPGKEYLIYLPEGGTATVDLSEATGILDAEWFSPVERASRAVQTVAGGGWRAIKAPFAGDAVLYIHKAQDKGQTR